MKQLICFDFCFTLVEGTTLEKVRELVPGGKVPEDILALGQEDLPDYIAMWRLTLKHLQDELGHSSEAIRQKVCSLPFVQGMPELLRALPTIGDGHCSGNNEVVIVTDSFVLFIEWVLDAANLRTAISKVVANPSWVDKATDSIHVEPYHHNDWCTESTRNMCKGRAIENYLAEQRERGVTYDRVVFVGDGPNDLCPAQWLGAGDLVCARRGYPLHMRLQTLEGCKGKDGNPTVVAETFAWDTGTDILKKLTVDSGMGSK